MMVLRKLKIILSFSRLKKICLVGLYPSVSTFCLFIDREGRAGGTRDLIIVTTAIAVSQRPAERLKKHVRDDWLLLHLCYEVFPYL